MSSTIFYIFTLIIIYLIIAISFITFTEHFAKDTFEYIFFKNEYFEIDTYTFIHFAVALIIAFFYPFYLDGFIMTFFVVFICLLLVIFAFGCISSSRTCFASCPSLC